jgi:ribose 1,5-bisphosphate isomerase
MNKFNKICKDIKSLKIQGANNIALAGLNALKLNPSQKAAKIIVSTRPTEPALKNAITFAKLTDIETAKNYLLDSKKRTTNLATSLIKNNQKIFTHCHSSTVIDALKEAKKQGKKFEVLNTETRPRFQGRKTSLELAKANIKNTHFVDSGAEEAVSQSDIILLGADMITPAGDVANKIGSEIIAKLAKQHKVPLYIITSSWKYSSKKLKIEERSPKEVWNKKNKFINIRNPAFELISPKDITAIVSGLGILKPKKLTKKIKKTYSWIK